MHALVDRSQACVHELQGQPPLHLAVQNDAYESVEMLLTCGADVNIQDYRVRSSSPCNMICVRT